MGNSAIVPAMCAVLVLCAACTTPHIFESFDADKDQSLSIDAKQRVILITNKGGVDHTTHVICAEPSPDVLSATAAALSLEGGNGEVKGSFAGSFSEAAGNIGMRTPTIQLLRDVLYRACEGYMNGAIDKEEYKTIVRNSDRIMVALLAIDAAAGTPHTQSVTIIASNSQATNSAQNPNTPTPDTGAAAVDKSKAATPPADGAGANNQTSQPSTQKPGTSVTVSPYMNNADQIIETVADYMLDNNKWLVAVCLDPAIYTGHPDPDLKAACVKVLNNPSLGKGRPFNGGAGPAGK